MSFQNNFSYGSICVWAANPGTPRVTPIACNENTCCVIIAHLNRRWFSLPSAYKLGSSVVIPCFDVNQFIS